MEVEVKLSRETKWTNKREDCKKVSRGEIERENVLSI